MFFPLISSPAYQTSLVRHFFFFFVSCLPPRRATKKLFLWLLFIKTERNSPVALATAAMDVKRAEILKGRSLVFLLFQLDANDHTCTIVDGTYKCILKNESEMESEGKRVIALTHRRVEEQKLKKLKGHASSFFRTTSATIIIIIIPYMCFCFLSSNFKRKIRHFFQPCFHRIVGRTS